MTTFENIDIDMAILENIDIGIDIDKGILQNIDINKISYRLGFGISNTPNQVICVQPQPVLWRRKWQRLPQKPKAVYVAHII